MAHASRCANPQSGECGGARWRRRRRRTHAEQQPHQRLSATCVPARATRGIAARGFDCGTSPRGKLGRHGAFARSCERRLRAGVNGAPAQVRAIVVGVRVARASLSDSSAAMCIKVVVLGAGGLVGERLIDALVAKTTFRVGGGLALPLSKIVLFDMRDLSADLKVSDPRVSCVAGDLTDRRTLDKLFDPDGCTRVTVIQLAALLSGYAEANFELGMKVNLHGAIGVMDALARRRRQAGRPADLPLHLHRLRRRVQRREQGGAGQRGVVPAVARLVRRAEGVRRAAALRLLAQGVHRRPRRPAVGGARAARLVEFDLVELHGHLHAAAHRERL